jgi:3-hexulose-6-phosphate synthase
MKLQIALDLLDLQKCLDIAKSVERYADSFQLGLPLLLKYGVSAIEQFRAAFPDKEIFAETQITNHEQDITAMSLKAGATWISVMAGTTKEVIHAVSSLAGQKNKFVIMDLFNNSSMGQSAMDANKLGVDALLYQNMYHENSENEFAIEEWDDLRGNSKLPIYIRANINRDNIAFILSLKPDAIIIGKAITQAKNPAEEAEFFYSSVQKA